jgi:hypothetical protein
VGERRDEGHVRGGHFAVFEANLLVVPKVPSYILNSTTFKFFSYLVVLVMIDRKGASGNCQVIQTKFILNHIS